MSSIARPLSHMPYFERLAEVANDSSEWRTVSAALVTLRLFDSWMTSGAEVVFDDAPGLNAVRDEIAAMDIRDTTRGLLSSIVEAMVVAEQPRIVTVAPRLMAYARALQPAAQWPLAADIDPPVSSHATPGTPGLRRARLPLGCSTRFRRDAAMAGVLDADPRFSFLKPEFAVLWTPSPYDTRHFPGELQKWPADHYPGGFVVLEGPKS
mgnify:CR=1 FL=1